MSARSLFDELGREGWKAVERMCSERIEEDEQVEFKQGYATRSGQLAKALSGFANADGGLLVLGVRTESAADRPKFDCVTSIVPLDDAERIADKIRASHRDLTEPSVPRVQVRVATRGASKNGVVGVLIPASDRAPHRVMVGDDRGRYFIRTASSTDVMPHTTLAAMFGREPRPMLRLHVERPAREEIRVSLLNEGRGAARHVLVRLGLCGPTGEPIAFRSPVREAYSGPVRDDFGPRFLLFPRDRHGLRSFHVHDVCAGVRLAGRPDCLGAQPVLIDHALPDVGNELVLPPDDEEQPSDE